MQLDLSYSIIFWSQIQSNLLIMDSLCFDSSKTESGNMYLLIQEYQLILKQRVLCMENAQQQEDQAHRDLQEQLNTGFL